MNKQVAWRLSLSEITVKIHRGNMIRKMQAKSLADLVRIADQLGVRAAPETPTDAPESRRATPPL
jgi:DNA-binding NarL/FixJ family response regulator